MLCAIGRRTALALVVVLFPVAAPAAACSLAADAPPAQYAGECVNGLAHGRGTATSPAYTYEGEFFQGRRHGRGVLNVVGGHRYEGEFVHGKRHGYGVTVLPDGGRHEGAWRDGEINGPGKLRQASGDVYEGEFKATRFHGRGVLQRPDGSRYDGQWVDGKRQGQGVQIYDTGAMASGEWHENKFMRGTYWSADRQSTRTFENGAIVQAPAPVAPASDPAQACRARADSCETACAAGTLLGLLITQGKGDADKARADCQASCDSGKADCLARLGPPANAQPVTAGGPTPVAGEGSRKYCAPRGHWCIHDRIVDAPPYRELKKACSFYFAAGYDPGIGGHKLEVVNDFDEASLRSIIAAVPPPGSRHHAYYSARAEVAQCLLESGHASFNKVGGEYFKADGHTFYVRRLPRSIWEDVVRYTQAVHAKNLSTASFDPGNAAYPKMTAYEEFYRKCGSIEILGTFYPVSWWEENLRALEAIAQQGTQWRGGESPIVQELRKYRCHKAEGWPYAADNQFWLQFPQGRAR
jgi:hypothetical protein